MVAVLRPGIPRPNVGGRRRFRRSEIPRSVPSSAILARPAMAANCCSPSPGSPSGFTEFAPEPHWRGARASGSSRRPMTRGFAKPLPAPNSSVSPQAQAPRSSSLKGRLHIEAPLPVVRQEPHQLFEPLALLPHAVYFASPRIFILLCAEKIRATTYAHSGRPICCPEYRCREGPSLGVAVKNRDHQRAVA